MFPWVKYAKEDAERQTDRHRQFAGYVLLIILRENKALQAGRSGEAPGSILRQREREMWAGTFIMVSSGKKGVGRTRRLRTGWPCLKGAAWEVHVLCDC